MYAAAAKVTILVLLSIYNTRHDIGSVYNRLANKLKFPDHTRLKHGLQFVPNTEMHMLGFLTLAAEDEMADRGGPTMKLDAYRGGRTVQ